MNGRVLVVDDSRAMRGILARILGSCGFAVVEAANGRQAYELLQSGESVDIALVDWNMPEMNGYDFICAVRQSHDWDAMPIMMVTTEAEVEQMTRALEAGANEYVMKPFTSDIIAGKLALLGFETAVA
jgi:two-component system chemotaxis response regulator CheY